MRVLVISLLRLGDFIQTIPVLGGLNRQYPLCELDVFTFDSVAQLAPQLPQVSKWWTLNRDSLQRGLGRGDVPMLTSFSLLKEKMDAINGRKYDWVINLTQTYFSAWLAGYIGADNRSGLTMDLSGQAHFHSPWFQYLDQHTDCTGDVFHHTDIFYYGSELKGTDRQWDIQETANGQEEVRALGLGQGEKIVVQLLTSEAKKTWPQPSWLELVTRLQQLRPQAQIVLLGAPAERTQVEDLSVQANSQGINTRPAILSLAGALSLLRQSHLLISGDTSIKHLANAAALPVLELSLGSSDYRRTGAFKPDSLILQPTVTCAPCPHSGPCSQSRHVCADQLSPELVANSACGLLVGDWSRITGLANEFAGQVRFLRTKHLANGFWLACTLRPNPRSLVDTVLERCAWRWVLNREHLDPVGRFGSEGVELRRELSGILPSQGEQSLLGHLDFLEQDTVQIAQRLNHMFDACKGQPIAARGDGVIDITSQRKQNLHLSEKVHYTNVKLKLIRSLKSQMMELK